MRNDQSRLEERWQELQEILKAEARGAKLSHRKNRLLRRFGDDVAAEMQRWKTEHVPPTVDK